MSLDRATVQGEGAKPVIEGIREAAEKTLRPAGLHVKLTGAPVMQLEIRNAVERDRLVYNGLGFVLGAVIAFFFFRQFSFMLMAVIPPILAVVWSLGGLGWAGFKLNLFLNVMTPLVMVMGFADSMQMTSAIRDRLRHGDTRDGSPCASAFRWWDRPACWRTVRRYCLSWRWTFSPSGLIRSFGMAGVLSVIVSYIVVIAALPVLGRLLIRSGGHGAAGSAAVDGAMDALGRFVGVVVDRVVRHPYLFSLLGFASFAALAFVYQGLEPRYRLADQVPDREQALSATASLDQKLTGGNPAHIMIEWKDGRSMFDPSVMTAMAKAHELLEKQAGVGNVWSVDSLRRWLAEAGDNRIETVKKYLGVLPETLVRRFVAKDETAVLVTGRLPDIDSSQILPVVDKLDKALDQVRKESPRPRDQRYRLAGDRGAIECTDDRAVENQPVRRGDLRLDPARPRLPLVRRDDPKPATGIVPGRRVWRSAAADRRRARVRERGRAGGDIRPRHR